MVSLSFLSSSTKRPLWQGQLLVVLCVVGFSLLGIGTRTSGYLAPFWGANAVMLGLRILAGMCDGAREKDGVGFNGLDTGFGHRLAGLPALTKRQALVARQMIRKYHRQLGQELINQM